MATTEAPIPMQGMDGSFGPPRRIQLTAEMKRWKVIYPVYINAKKTVAEGRRLPLAKCVDAPTPVEIAEACARLRVPCVLEADKCYSRDFGMYGRIRVCLKDASGAPCNPEVPKRKALMAKVAEIIPTLESRAPKTTKKDKKKKGTK